MRNRLIILLIIMIIFTSVSFVALNIYYSNLKRDYIDSFGNVFMKVSESDPELADQIIPSITSSRSEEERIQARKTLKEYGITPELENSLFPNLDKSYKENNIIFIIIFIFLLLILLIFNYLENKYFYMKIRKISDRAKDIVKGEFKTFPEDDKEGDFPKLISSFNSMTNIIKSNLDELKEEKNFLVDLLSDISHQLKTPLSSMIVYNDILTEKELQREKQLLFLENNRKQLERIEWLIKSLLKLARLDARAIKFEKENLDLNCTIKSAIEAVNERKTYKDINIEVDGENSLYLEHDFYWIKEAIINLLVNAIDHSKVSSYINIRLIETPIYKRIEIEDFGEGIDRVDLAHIFKRFYKAKNSNSDSVGIGLALSKSIIEGHDGIIEAESTKGSGTKFMITFLKY